MLHLRYAPPRTEVERDVTLSEREQRVAHALNMNCDEGHLGGYIRASATPAPSGLRIENGDPATWTPSLWDWAFRDLGVRSVLDVGCAEGMCAGYFEKLGCRVLGVDGSLQALDASIIPDSHVLHDYATGPFTPKQAFDLVWSCEFVEHVEEAYLPNFLASFRAGARYLMMTYAPPGQPGWHHVNCQPEAYWLEKMAGIGFRYEEALTREARRVAADGHYHRKGLLFTRTG